MFRFASPYFFLLLLIVPAAVWHHHRRRSYPAIRFPTLSGLGKIKPSTALRLHWIMPALQYTVLILMVAALARPQWGTRRVSVTSEGVNIILAVDLSESMAALDFKRDGKVVNRLAAVKAVIKEFLPQRQGDRIGMVVFGSQAYTQMPLTGDYDTIATILDRLEIGAAGKSTAIGDAIGISLKRLEDIRSTSNIIILLTDGRSNSGEFTPGVAAEIAAQKDVKIYTVGVGSRGKVPFVVNHPVLGEQVVYQRVDIDEDALRSIAAKTGGAYFRAQDTDELQKIYATIDKLETTEVKVKTYAEYREWYLYLLLPALALLLFWVLLGNTRYLRVP